ncbi:MAG: SRPBCC family protein [Candidatus Alcyoniella australis]|nr:SRPBCC family protein [Candidatus Alcyoniella australis]
MRLPLRSTIRPQLLRHPRRSVLDTLQRVRPLLAPALIACLLLVGTLCLPARADSPEPDCSSAQPLQTVSISVEINADPAMVYPYLVDEDKIVRWNGIDSMVHVSFPNSGCPVLGKRMLITIDFISNPSMLMEFVEVDPGRLVKIAFIDGMLGGWFVYRLEPLANGGTRLINEMSIQPNGRVFGVLWQIYGKTMYHNKMRCYWAKLKQVVEQDLEQIQK